jgi:ABC-type phosphate/phosphonate transport system permease subunit
MQDDRVRDQTVHGGASDEGAPSAKPAKPRRRWWPLIVFGVVVVLPTLVLAAWIAIALNWHYSAGNRAGFIQKFSQKGWVCKTWEGEIAMVNMPGAAQERFAFSVRDDNVAKDITRLMGGHVSLAYEEHRGLPGSCFGETRYYVTGVKAIP